LTPGPRENERLPKTGRIGENGAMRKRQPKLSAGTAVCLVLVGLALSAGTCLHGQGSSTFSAKDMHPARDGVLPDQLPEKPTIPPIFTIPVEPLGFSAPGAIYLGMRNCMVSLDFIDESRLLFTFRVPGLMHREPGATTGSDERQIRAVVLGLPDGAVTAEALWTVHDRIRYLWMLRDGHFLLRDKDGIKDGDAALNLKPMLQFPGPVLWLELDPLQQFLVTNSQEPVKEEPKPGDVASPATAHADMQVDGEKPGVPDMVVRILRRDSGKVMLVSRVRTAVHLPINSDGYVESLRGNGDQWLLNLNYFSGGSTVLGHVDSSCPPSFDFISQRELLVTACDMRGGRKLLALDTDGHRLWEVLSSPQAIWPLLVASPDGSRLVRETLAVNHAINAYSPLDSEDIKGQLVRVFDAATGKVALETRASPALDGGGNVAISPSGRRVAVVNAGAIEVFELPVAPQLGDDKKLQAGH
jgi:hypothetical protein